MVVIMVEVDIDCRQHQFSVYWTIFLEYYPLFKKGRLML